MSGPTSQVRATAPRGARALQALCAALGVVLVVLLALLTLQGLSGTGRLVPVVRAADTPVAPVAAPAPGPAADAPADDVPDVPAVGATPAADAEALATLRRLRTRGLADHPPQGQWVAQLAAKSIGTTDPGQRAANGSSTFYAADILTQTRRIASGIAGGDVFVLASTDFGESAVDARGNPYWTTFADGPFAEASDVRAWCDSVFASTPERERANACFPRQLTAPD
ncbi:hypothetical protein MO973_38680 [Paenibacillus sp. TRM 82003]|uniref:hypothetical protein n=1 Tax=Kineococcus sp. TRM81007 TaxID=2925831 RepID=UPI001F572243|nr:hypothetical protein [Kineococcus sp. TRM81007]MCI2239588.1 hypothetical protein [Kineococcus sp. TRM81007]MCI3926130.1 hypothetical protein [Paenibacillus sp. TRM 82003]